MIKPPLDLFPQGSKIQMRLIVIFRVSTQLFLPTTNQNLSEIQNSICEDYASLQWFQGRSPTVKWCQKAVILWINYTVSREIHAKPKLVAGCIHSSFYSPPWDQHPVGWYEKSFYQFLATARNRIPTIRIELYEHGFCNQTSYLKEKPITVSQCYLSILKNICI